MILRSSRHSNRLCGLRSRRGFTLIELMLVVVILGIIAAFAYPTFLDQVYKSRRGDGKAMLMSVASKQQQFYLDNKTFTNSMTAMGYSADPEDSSEGYYRVDVTAASATAYTLRARAQNGQTSDSKCLDYTLNSQGTVTVSGSEPVGKCW